MLSRMLDRFVERGPGGSYLTRGSGLSAATGLATSEPQRVLGVAGGHVDGSRRCGRSSVRPGGCDIVADRVLRVEDAGFVGERELTDAGHAGPHGVDG